MNDFLDGAAFAGFLAVAAWFLRSWLTTRDRLLLAFSLAFALFAVNRVLLAVADRTDEGATAIYGLRLLAFGLIIAAIVDRNLTSSGGRRSRRPEDETLTS